MIMALDLGTTGNRAIIFDAKGDIVASSYREFTQYFPEPGWVEHDPLEIWNSVQSVMAKVASHTGNVSALGITNQRETVVVWNRETGQPIYNAIVWQCRRTADLCTSLKAQHEAMVHAKTGLWIDPYFSATKIAWILDHVAGAREDAEAGKLACGTMDTWIIWQLTNGKVHATDPSNASRTLLYDIYQNQFSSFLLDLFRVPVSLLPELRPSNGDFGKTASGLPIRGVLGDQQAALFAQAGIESGVVKNTYGTGLFLMAPFNPSVSIAIPNEGRLLTTMAFAVSDKVLPNPDSGLKNAAFHYAVEGSVFTGGSVLQWLRDGLGLIGSASESETLAASIPDNGDVYCVPALTGLGSPYWDPYARGLLIGMTRGTTKSHIVRAALESLAYQTRDMVDSMQPFLGTSPKCLRVDGGAAANDWLMQFQANILGIPVDRPKVLETTALGAAAMAGIGAGVLTVSDLSELRQSDRIFEPQMSAEDRARLYSRWQQAVVRSLSWSV
jgi:glycerol kinase